MKRFLFENGDFQEGRNRRRDIPQLLLIDGFEIAKRSMNS